MDSVEKQVTGARKIFLGAGLRGKRLEQEVACIKERLTIAQTAFDAYDAEVPEDEGPVWFGDESWKTHHWKQSWRLRKAFRAGEKARLDFFSKDHNPYLDKKGVLSYERLLLEQAWNNGFNGT